MTVGWAIIRWVWIAAASLLALGFVLYVCAIVWAAECYLPSSGAA